MIKEKIKLVHVFPPSISTIDGIKYLFPGWIPISNDTELCDIEWSKPDYLIKKDEILLDDKVWEVPALRGKTIYNISRESNEYRCTCSGFAFRRKCKHIDKIKFDENEKNK